MEKNYMEFLYSQEVGPTGPTGPTGAFILGKQRIS